MNMLRVSNRTIFGMIFAFYRLILAGEVVPGTGILDLSVSVVDVDGDLINGAEIKILFSKLGDDGNFFHLERKERSSSEGPVQFRELGASSTIVVSKEGYYKYLHWDHWLEARHPRHPDVFLQFAETKKEYIVELREIVDPRPLYVHRLNNLILKKFNHKYGYDLTMRDLVQPDGEGVTADMYFTMTGEVDEGTKMADVSIVLSFPNEGDGIHPIRQTMPGTNLLLLGHNAPEDGYIPTFRMQVTGPLNAPPTARQRTPSDQEQTEHEGFWFRTHTEIDPETKEVVRARHGKFYFNDELVISFDFRMETPRQTQGGYISFNYFYAPDHSRSVEYNGETLVPNANTHGIRKR